MLEPFSCAIDHAAAVVGQDRGTSVLVVGNESLAQQVGQLLRDADLDGQIQVVSDCLMALGQVAVDPPSVLIIRIEDLDDPLECTCQAMRRLAPDSRLLVLTPPGQQSDAQRVIAAGFDESLLEPIDARRLGQVVSGDSRFGLSNVDEFDEEVPWLIKQGPSHHDILSQGASDPVDPMDDHLDPGPGQGPAPVSPDQIDTTKAVVEQLLRGRGEGAVRQAALESISASIGVGSVSWSSRSEQVPEDHARVPVEHSTGPMGLLHAPLPVLADQLQPWAPWLGQWLVLSRHVDRLWRLAMHDETTSLWNRRYFNQFLKAVLERAAGRRFHVSLLVFDIDDFKTYNDRYGHIAGDEILRETAKLMQSLVREHDVVARIGGDEFAVIFWDPAGPRRPNSAHPHDPIEVARRFQRAICGARFPKLGHEAPGTLTISGGLAGFPWDGHTPQQLLDLADKMALRSKQQGKNAITIGDGAQRNCTEMSR